MYVLYVLCEQYCVFGHFVLRMRWYFQVTNDQSIVVSSCFSTLKPVTPVTLAFQTVASAYHTTLTDILTHVRTCAYLRILHCMYVHISIHNYAYMPSCICSPTCLVSTLKGTANLYFLSEILVISTG